MGFRCSSSSNSSSNTSPQIDINYGSSPYTLNHGNGGGANGEKETDNRGYYSPGLNDDIFPNVQADTMLLQAVDSVQLANTIQVNARITTTNCTDSSSSSSSRRKRSNRIYLGRPTVFRTSKSIIGKRNATGRIRDRICRFLPTTAVMIMIII